MKKLLLFTTVILFVFALHACNGQNGGNGGQQGIELTYADWGNQEFNQLLIDAFMEEYPDIRVTLRGDIDGAGDIFTGNLVTAAQAGLLPDVYAIDNVPTAVNAGLTLDVAPYWDADPESALVYENIATTAVYQGQRLAMPSYQFFKGIFINFDIFDNANLTTTDDYRVDLDGYPVKDWTFDEFIAIIKAVTNYTPENPETLVIGMANWFGAPDFQQVWPTMFDADVLYDTYDGTAFHYTSPEWIDAMTEKVDLHRAQNGWTTNLSLDDLEEYEVLNQFLTTAGYVALDIDGSWMFWMINEAVENGFNLGFWPYPQGPAGFFPPTILDYICVSSQTDHPEEAYLLAKWMTWGRQGWEARLDIYEADKAAALAAGEVPTWLDRFPVADYPDVWDRVFDLVDGIEGIEYTIDHIANAKPDLDKWLPGYKDFWAWVFDGENPYNWMNLVEAGPAAVGTYAVQWNNRINDIVTQEKDRLGNE